MEPPKIWREKEQKYLLLGTLCHDCQKKTYPYASYCPNCTSKNVESYKLPTKGKVLYFTYNTSTNKEMMFSAPYVSALIELEDGTRITGQIVDCDHATLKEGREVVAVFRILAKDSTEGLIQYGVKFTPY